MNKKVLAASLLIISLTVALSGCTDLFNVLQTYVPTITPGPSTHIEIGENVPASIVKDVTIAGAGNTVTITGRGPYNVNAHQEYITLNKGGADFSIKLKGQGFGCTISMDYTSPITGNTELVRIHEFTVADRVYEITKRVDVPFTARYCLMVNWGGDWEIRITQ